MLSVSAKGFATDFIFKSHAEIQAFVNSVPFGTFYTVDNLYVTGSDVTQQDINGLTNCIDTVNVKLTFIDLTYPGDGKNDGSDAVVYFDDFLSNVYQKGGIVMQNCPNIGWSPEGGGKGFIGSGLLPKHIHGDLILDSIPIPFPGVDGWADNTAFGAIEQVDGDFILGSRSSLQKMGWNWFTQLQRVGGSFRIYLTGSPWVYSLPAPYLTYIGGDFEIHGPGAGEADNGTNLAGQIGGSDLQLADIATLQNVTYIGGNVTISNCPFIQIGEGIPTSSYSTPGTGYCFVRYLIDTDVINYACANVMLGMTDDPIDLANLGACIYGDGNNRDDPPYPLPDKDPNCATGIPAVKAAPAFAIIQPTYVKDDLTVTSTANLAKVDVISITGQTVKSFTAFTGGQNTLPVSNLTNGIYLVRLVSVNNEVQTVKIIKL